MISIHFHRSYRKANDFEVPRFHDATNTMGQGHFMFAKEIHSTTPCIDNH